MQILNRKAHFNYHITEEIEAGIILLGSEVKSLREGKASISEAYIVDKNSELILINSNISEYKGANRFNHLPKRERKLLLRKKQIDKIIGKIHNQGLSVVPIKVYFNKKNYAKILIGIAKGKKLYDKREVIKKRDENRRAMREED
ncbi:MAG: SsrA-binding protein SmpB [Proteobacteria bacterium]|nr:SsrA-binding protein SmpB [Pseudomonadota bacterium]NCA28391.1 SsrA-binding protein SmpB [Pseudomonadota bacterium]